VSMTRLNIRDEVAARSRIVDADIGEKTILNNFINRTLEEIQVFSKWWFLEHEFVLNTSQAPVLAAGTREYAFPALDIDGNTADLSEIDRQSMHTKSEHMEYFWPDQQDRAYPGWMDPSNTGSTGSPKYWTTLREQILFDKAPSAAWVAANTIYFRGKVNIELMANDTDIPSQIPEQWHWIVVEGALWRALHYQDPMGRAWESQKSHFSARGRRYVMGKSILEQMVEQSSPVQKRPSKVSAPGPFKITGRRSSNVGG
jgi:hypothetical protein